MHTISPNSNKKWNVVFTGNGFHLTIERDLTKTQAMSLVNYLNGGLGHHVNDMPEIKATFKK